MLNQELTTKELKQLGDFLSKGQRRDWMGLTELHAFLCALISGPVLVMPSEWHPYAFSEDGLEFDSEEEAQMILMLLSRLNNQVVYQLAKDISCEPILYEDGNLISYTNSRSEELLQHWCSAYLEGSRFDKAWREEEVAVGMLLPFAVLANEFSLQGERDAKGHVITDESIQRMHFTKQLPQQIVALYNFWQSRRVYPHDEQESTITFDRHTTKIGRNELCPCGSGKKYKKCCLNSQEVTYH